MRKTYAKPTLRKTGKIEKVTLQDPSPRVVEDTFAF